MGRRADRFRPASPRRAAVPNSRGMTTASPQQPMSWTARLAWAVLLLIAGAGLAVWGLSRWDSGARFLGVTPPPVDLRSRLLPIQPVPIVTAPSVADAQRMAALEARLALLERETQVVQGSAGRADALVIAFAARRAVERGDRKSTRLNSSH